MTGEGSPVRAGEHATTPPGGAWYALSDDEAFEALGVDRDGLAPDAAARRLREHGPNRIREQEEVSPWRILVDQFRSPLIYVLLGALAVTLTIESYSDAIVIAVVLVVNGTIGFVQEYQAESAVQSLMDMVSRSATVRRGGREQQIDAEELVPGDVVALSQGQVVAADVRLFEVEGLRVDESPLTGESVPADKVTDAIEDEEHLPPADQRNLAFMGTAVTSGRGWGVVVATGPRSQIGRIAEQVSEAQGTTTPLQQRIDRLSRWITVTILAVAAVAMVVGVLTGRDLFTMLLLAVALAVAAIPAGLPIVVTVALAIGVRRMSERHALIRQLHAVDTLGSCDTILSDKTGTLTQNRMVVKVLAAGDGRYGFAEHGKTGPVQDGEVLALEDLPAVERALLAGLLCNEVPAAVIDDAHPAGDPMEVALVRAAAAAGMSAEQRRDAYPRRATVPFRTERRYMATVHDTPVGEPGPLVVVKGAPEVVLSMCSSAVGRDGQAVDLKPDEVRRRGEELAGDGLRVIAVATGRGEEVASSVLADEPGGLTLAGLHGLFDPPRDSAIEAIERSHQAGIRVLMVTGDHATTAVAIGEQVGIRRPADEVDSDDRAGRTAVTGQELGELSDDDLRPLLDETNVYARVAPGQKLRIVEGLQAEDHIVAVTGDGVNDAPALESAHIGAAMGSGTDVAKEASDMVITDDDFASVYAAVEEGRTAFRNVRVATFFLLSTGGAVVLVILAALGFDWPLPLIPAQILWCNVVTNGIADVALAFEPGEKALFRRPPRPKSEGVLDRTLLERLVLVAVWLAVGTAAVFYWSWEIRGDDLTVARTMALTTMVLFQKVHVFNCRSEDVSIFNKPLLSNKLLFAGVLTSLAVHIGALYLPVTQDLLGVTPLDGTAWLVAIAVASTAIIVNELHKRLRPRPVAAV